jgi:hypothetical protein
MRQPQAFVVFRIHLDHFARSVVLPNTRPDQATIEFAPQLADGIFVCDRLWQARTSDTLHGSFHRIGPAVSQNLLREISGPPKDIGTIAPLVFHQLTRNPGHKGQVQERGWQIWESV